MYFLQRTQSWPTKFDGSKLLVVRLMKIQIWCAQKSQNQFTDVQACWNSLVCYLLENVQDEPKILNKGYLQLDCYWGCFSSWNFYQGGFSLLTEEGAPGGENHFYSGLDCFISSHRLRERERVVF